MKTKPLVVAAFLLLANLGNAEDLVRCIETDTTMRTNLIGPVLQFTEGKASIGVEYSRLLNSYSVFFNSTRPVFGHVFTGIYSFNRGYHFSYGFEVVGGRFLSCLGRKQYDSMKNPEIFLFLVPGVEFGVDYSSRHNLGGHITGFLPWVFAYPFVSYKQFANRSDVSIGVIAKMPISEIYLP